MPCGQVADKSGEWTDLRGGACPLGDILDAHNQLSAVGAGEKALA
jgi:hypothetical protein